MRLTQPEMAERMGLKPRQYISYEQGEYDSNPSKVDQYSKRLDEVLQDWENIRRMDFEKVGNLQTVISDLQKQIDTMNGKLSRVMDRLNMT